MAEVHAAQGRFEDAIAAAQQAVEAAPAWKWVLGITYAAAGRRDEALEIAAEIERWSDRPWKAFSLAIVYTNTGDLDRAFQWLDYEHPHAWIPWIRVGQWFTPLHDDPRFPALMERMNLPWESS